jgi:hypothetical protein
MLHRSMRGALWWFIDRKFAIFCFWKSAVPWKLTKKKGIVSYAVQDTLLPSTPIRKTEVPSILWRHTYRCKPKIRKEESKTSVASRLSGLLAYKTEKMNNITKPLVAAPATPNAHVLSTVFEISQRSIACARPTIATLLLVYNLWFSSQRGSVQ